MSAYATTTVPIERSKEAIRKLLIHAGVKGVQFAENFETGEINVRFAKEVEGDLRTVSVTMQVPEPPPVKRKRSWRYSRGRIVYAKTSGQRREQAERATYRALHYWLKSKFEAISFGLLSFDDEFLSHFEWVVDGQRTTVGALIKPRLSAGANLLSAPR